MTLSAEICSVTVKREHAKFQHQFNESSQPSGYFLLKNVLVALNVKTKEDLRTQHLRK